MKTYENLHGNSGISAYEISEDGSYIDVEFSSGGVYRYTKTSVGKENLTIMKVLATAGAGLNGFINKHVRNRYANRFGYPTPTTPATPANVTLTPDNAAAVVSELVRSGKSVNISIDS